MKGLVMQFYNYQLFKAMIKVQIKKKHYYSSHGCHLCCNATKADTRRQTHQQTLRQTHRQTTAEYMSKRIYLSR